MNEQMMQEDPLLQLIPKEHLSSEQKSFRPTENKDGNDLQMYKMIREPTHLNDLDWKSYSKAATWRDNNTFICVCENDYHEPMRVQFEEPNVCFVLWVGRTRLLCAIYGKTKESALETAVFLWSLKELKETKVYLEAWTFEDDKCKKHGFDFAALQPNQLAQILDANPQREFELYTGTWSPELSVILASRPQPINLQLVKNHKCNEGFRFTDEGTAFINALANRKSSFGSLSISYDNDTTPFSRNNLERLLQLGKVVEKLQIGRVGEDCALLPFSANTKALAYKVYAKHMLSMNFRFLKIHAKDLRMTIYLDEVKDFCKFLVKFLHRLAKIGHFERLYFNFYHRDLGNGVLFEGHKIAQVAEAVNRVITANAKLNHLDLSGTDFLVDTSSIIKIMTPCMESHKGLRTLKVGAYPPMDDSVFGESSDFDDDDSDDEDGFERLRRAPAWLDKLLHHNRKITVLDQEDNRCSNGPSTEQLYSLNAFYNGSAEIIKASPSVRSSLVVVTLVERATSNFQYGALLLSVHADVLCDFLHTDTEEDGVAQPMEVDEEQEQTATHVPVSRKAKKMRESK